MLELQVLSVGEHATNCYLLTCLETGQALLALHVTLATGYDPEHPRGLKKVTETQ